MFPDGEWNPGSGVTAAPAGAARAPTSAARRTRLMLRKPTPRAVGGYAPQMKQFASGRLTVAAGRYAEQAPVATACCMTCRTCVTSNLLGLALVPVLALT